MMLPLFMLLILVTVTSGFDLLVLDNNYLGASIVHHHSAHMNPLPLTERVSLSQKMKGFFLLWEPPLHSEYMGRIKNSSSAFVEGEAEGEDNSTFCEKNAARGSQRVHFNSEPVVFPGREDTLNTTSDTLNTTSEGLTYKLGLDHKSASKDETNQIVPGNSSTVPVYPSEEPTSFSINVKDVHPDTYDQIVGEHEENSTVLAAVVALATIMLILVAGGNRWRKA
ncbi:hypothetical protein SUGI_0393030 [Cryptomeria japonica]|nr:hypothetical protein SUGI_0393030 [Cryptomeria japonica]